MFYKIAFFFLAYMISLTARGQRIELVNLNVSQKESKNIYIGIDNSFKIKGFEFLQKVKPANSIYFIQDDIIILKPNQAGSFALAFHTTNGVQQVNFDVKVISDVLPAIGNLTNEVVDKNEVITQAKINLHSFNNKETYYENYLVSSFEAQLNSQIFSIEGEKFSDELLEAVKQSKPGDTLKIVKVKARNADIDKTISLDSKISFTLK